MAPERPQEAPQRATRSDDLLFPPFKICKPSGPSQCVRYDVWRDGWHGGWCVTHDVRWSSDFNHCDNPQRVPAWVQRMKAGQLKGKDLTGGER